MHIADATSIDNHIRSAIKEDFYLAKETLIPGELSGSIRFVNNSDRMAIRLRMGFQAGRVGGLAEDLTETQMIRGARTPDCIASASGKLKTVSILALSPNFHMGGGNWIG